MVNKINKTPFKFNQTLLDYITGEGAMSYTQFINRCF